MRFKPGVVVVSMHPEVAALIDNGSELDVIFGDYAGRDCIITGARDGKHGGESYVGGSGHYRGRAIDLRTKDLDHITTTGIASALGERLGDDWFVLVESTHIHLEYDEVHRYAR